MQTKEKVTLLKFIFLYVGSTVFLLVFLLFQYYIFQKELILKNEQLQSEQDIAKVSMQLKLLHFSNDDLLKYPRFNDFKSAIYDIEEQLIFSEFQTFQIDFTKLFFTQDTKLYFIHKNENYFLGAAYIVIEKNIPSAIRQLEQTIAIIFTISVLFILCISFFLSKMFLKPMRDTIVLLDNFIKDTTHELNTPINTIMANIELLDSVTLDALTTRKINRIKLASKTIVNIYEDMVFSVFGKAVSTKNEELNLADIIEERLRLFDVAIQAKKLSVITVLDDSRILMDKHKFEKVFDNLLSNAIKYNKQAGTIHIKLHQSSLIMEDSGEGFENENIQNIFNRYTRFSKSAGGFGIGMNIVKMILDEYKIQIVITSQKEIGTKVNLQW